MRFSNLSDFSPAKILLPANASFPIYFAFTGFDSTIEF